jgi:membrane protein DedA with SNARE-associated domain
MKYWLVTLSASVGWAGSVIGIMYLHTHAQNDALDAKYGQLAGVGFVFVWAFAILRRWKKKAADDR